MEKLVRIRCPGHIRHLLLVRSVRFSIVYFICNRQGFTEKLATGRAKRKPRTLFPRDSTCLLGAVDEGRMKDALPDIWMGQRLLLVPQSPPATSPWREGSIPAHPSPAPWHTPAPHHQPRHLAETELSPAVCLAPYSQRRLRVICQHQLLGLVCLQRCPNTLGVMKVADKSRCPAMMRPVASRFCVTFARLGTTSVHGWQKSLPMGGQEASTALMLPWPKNAGVGRVQSWPKPTSGIRKFTPNMRF